MATEYYITSPESGRKHHVKFEKDASEEDLNFALTHIVAQEKDTGQSTAESALQNIPRSFGSSIGSTFEGLGDVGSLFAGDNYLQEMGRAIKEDAAVSFPVNPANEGKWGVKAAGVVGQVGEQAAEMFAGGPLFRAAGLTGKAATQAAFLVPSFLKGADAGEDVARQYDMGGVAKAISTLGGGLIEAATEKFGSKFLPGGGTALETGIVSSLLNRGTKKALGIGTKKALIGGVVGEGLEEVEADLANAGLSRLLVTEDPNRKGFALNGQPLPSVSAGSLAESFSLGAVGGLVFSAPHIVSNLAQAPRRMVEYEDSDGQTKATPVPEWATADHVRDEGLDPSRIRMASKEEADLADIVEASSTLAKTRAKLSELEQKDTLTPDEKLAHEDLKKIDEGVTDWLGQQGAANLAASVSSTIGQADNPVEGVGAAVEQLGEARSLIEKGGRRTLEADPSVFTQGTEEDFSETPAAPEAPPHKSDHELANRPLSEITALPIEERAAAITERMEAAKRIFAALKKGDTVVDDEGNEMVVDWVSHTTDAMTVVGGRDVLKNAHVMFSSGSARDSSGNAIDIPGWTVKRAETPLTKNPEALPDETSALPPTIQTDEKTQRKGQGETLLSVPPLTDTPAGDSPGVGQPPVAEQKELTQAQIDDITTVVGMPSWGTKGHGVDVTAAEAAMGRLAGVPAGTLKFVRSGNSKVFRDPTTGDFVKLITMQDDAKAHDLIRQLEFIQKFAPQFANTPTLRRLTEGVYVATQKSSGVEGASIYQGLTASDKALFKELMESTPMASDNPILRTETDQSLKNIGLLLGADGMVRPYAFDFDGVESGDFESSRQEAETIASKFKENKGVPLSSFSEGAQKSILSHSKVNKSAPQSVAPPTVPSVGQPPARVTRHRVFEGGFPMRMSDAEGVLPAKDPDMAYRLTGQAQIDDMAASGEVRAREGKMRGGRSGETQWSRGHESIGYRAANNDGKYVVVAPVQGLNDREGGMPLDEVSQVWKSENGKWVDVTQSIKAAPPTVPSGPIFSEDYTGPRWTYGLRNRPLDMATVPKGWIIGSNGPPEGRSRYGTVQFPRELTKDEIYDFELEVVSGPSAPQNVNPPVALAPPLTNTSGQTHTEVPRTAEEQRKLDAVLPFTPEFEQHLSTATETYEPISTSKLVKGDILKINGRDFRVESVDDRRTHRSESKDDVSVTIFNPSYGRNTVPGSFPFVSEVASVSQTAKLLARGERIQGLDKVAEQLANTGLAAEVETLSNDEMNQAVVDESAGQVRPPSGNAPKGSVKGFIVPRSKTAKNRGKTVVYLNRDQVRADTPIHEVVGHQFMPWIKKNHPEIWSRGVELLRQNLNYLDAVRVAYFEEIENLRAQEGDAAAEAYLLEEALATVLGQKGQDVWQSTAASRSLWGQIKAWVERVMTMFKRWGANNGLFNKAHLDDYGIHGLTVEQWARNANLALRTGAFAKEIAASNVETEGGVKESKSIAEETNGGVAPVTPAEMMKFIRDATTAVSEALTAAFPDQVEFPKRQRPVNPVAGSMVSPPRLSIIEHNYAMPDGIKFTNLEQFQERIAREVGRMVAFFTANPGMAQAALKFYSGMGDAAYELANGDFDKADLFLRWFAYLSPRSSVISNAAKAIGAGVSGETSAFSPGVKAGTFKQISGMGIILQEWMSGESFGMHLSGVDNKVRNFYLNGASELLDRAKRENASDEVLLKLGKKLASSLQTSLATRGGVVVKVNGVSDLPALSAELYRLVTSDMWDQASLGNVRAGFMFSNSDSYKWVVPGRGKVVTLDSPEGQRVLEYHKKEGENAKRKAKAKSEDDEYDEEDVGGDGVTGWGDLSWQELESLDYDESAGTIRVFEAADDGEKFLAAKGEGPIYDVSQAIGGTIADAINAMGGLAGKKRWTAYNVQEFRWGMEKTGNPRKANRDFSSYDEVVSGLKELAKYLENGGVQQDIEAAVAGGTMTRKQADVALENLDSSTNVATLKSLMTKLGKSPRFVGSLGASEYAYSLQARQLIPFEIGSQYGGGLYRTILENLKKKKKLTDAELLERMVGPGFVLGLQNAAQAAGLPILVRTAETGSGSYLGATSPMATLEASGPRWATKILNEAITRALEQTDGNLIRNPTLGEISAGAKLTTVVQVRIGEGATNAQIDDFIAEMGRIPDSNGATSGGFLGGHTTIRDAEGKRVVAMHGGFYKTGNFLVEVDKVMAQINSSAKRIFGPDSQVDTTDRIVEAYGHDPSAKYKQPLKGGEGETDGENEQNRSRRKTVETVSIGRQAEQGLRAYFLSSLAAAAAKRRGTVTSGKDAQDVLGEFVSHIENYFAFRSKRVAKLAPETKQAVGISNPKEALVALSARAIAEGLENPKVLGLASLLWDIAQRVQRGGIADVQIHKSMTPQEMRDANTALLERVAFKSEREVGKRRAKIEDDMRKEGRKKALEQEVEDDKLREAAAAPAPEGETAPQKDKRVKEFERRIAAALKAKEKREKELEKDIAAALKAVLPGKGVILKGGGKYSVPTGFAALPLEVGSVLLVNKRRAEYDHGENWREAAVEAQKKKTAIKVYLETLAPVAGAYGYAVTTTLDGQVSRAEVISDEVGRRLIGELEAEEGPLAETPSEPSDIKMSKSIDELGVDESTQNVQGANRDGTYSTEKSQGDQRRGDRGGRSDSRRAEALPGAPRIQKASGPDPGLNRVAERYARSIGLNLARQSHYAEVDEDLAKSIADAYEQMPHAPRDPVVAEAYANLIRQTTDQYRALEEDGYQFWFVDPSNDSGYLDSPYNAMRDIRANKSMGVYPTNAGFGSGATDIDVSENPLLADTGIEWPYGSLDGPLKPVTANDLFRAVHDAFGHGIEGAGFRARGEENAWQAHARLFTGSALGALTTETRGQNSWLNFGPYREKNRNASVKDTVFGDQKTGLMPSWTWERGRLGDATPDIRFSKSIDDEYLKAVESGDVAKQQAMVDAAAKAAGYDVGPVFHGTTSVPFTSFDNSKRGENTGAASAKAGFFFSQTEPTTRSYLKDISDVDVELTPRDKKTLLNFAENDDEIGSVLSGLDLDYYATLGHEARHARLYNGLSRLQNIREVQAVAIKKRLRLKLETPLPANRTLRVYLRMENPKVFDYGRKSYREETYASVIASAKREGNDGVVLRNTWDGGPLLEGDAAKRNRRREDLKKAHERGDLDYDAYWRKIEQMPLEERYEDIYVAFDPNQIKSADPVTYDDQGEVIPISQRFSASNDIRFSKSIDEDPLRLSEIGQRQTKLLPDNLASLITNHLQGYRYSQGNDAAMAEAENYYRRAGGVGGWGAHMEMLSNLITQFDATPRDLSPDEIAAHNADAEDIKDRWVSDATVPLYAGIVLRQAMNAVSSPNSSQLQKRSALAAVAQIGQTIIPVMARAGRVMQGLGAAWQKIVFPEWQVEAMERAFIHGSLKLADEFDNGVKDSEGNLVTPGFNALMKEFNTEMMSIFKEGLNTPTTRAEMLRELERRLGNAFAADDISDHVEAEMADQGDILVDKIDSYTGAMKDFADAWRSAVLEEYYLDELLASGEVKFSRSVPPEVANALKDAIRAKLGVKPSSEKIGEVRAEIRARAEAALTSMTGLNKAASPRKRAATAPKVAGAKAAPVDKADAGAEQIAKIAERILTGPKTKKADAGDAAWDILLNAIAAKMVEKAKVKKTGKPAVDHALSLAALVDQPALAAQVRDLAAKKLEAWAEENEGSFDRAALDTMLQTLIGRTFDASGEGQVFTPKDAQRALRDEAKALSIDMRKTITDARLAGQTIDAVVASVRKRLAQSYGGKETLNRVEAVLRAQWAKRMEERAQQIDEQDKARGRRRVQKLKDAQQRANDREDDRKKLRDKLDALKAQGQTMTQAERDNLAKTFKEQREARRQQFRDAFKGRDAVEKAERVAAIREERLAQRQAAKDKLDALKEQDKNLTQAERDQRAKTQEQVTAERRKQFREGLKTEDPIYRAEQAAIAREAETDEAKKRGKDEKLFNYLARRFRKITDDNGNKVFDIDQFLNEMSGDERRVNTEAMLKDIADRLGYSRSQAERFIAPVLAAATRKMDEKRKAKLEKILNPKAMKRGVKESPFDKQLRLIRLGALDHESYANILLGAQGKKGFTDEFKAKLTEMVRRRDAAAPGSAQQGILDQEIRTFVHSVKGVGIGTLAGDVWGAHVFSGLVTQKVNFVAGVVGSWTALLTRSKAAINVVNRTAKLTEAEKVAMQAAIFKLALTGYTDKFAHAASQFTLRTGLSHEQDKYLQFSGNSLETTSAYRETPLTFFDQDLPEWLDPVANGIKTVTQWHKYVRRFMASTDLLNRAPVWEGVMAQQSLPEALQLLRSEGKPVTPSSFLDAIDRVNYGSGGREAAVRSAQEQVAQEVADGALPNDKTHRNERVRELLQEKLNPLDGLDTAQRIHEIKTLGARATLSYDLPGVLGGLSNLLNNIAQFVPLGKQFFAAIRVPIAAVHTSLDYFPPVSFARWAIAKGDRTPGSASISLWAQSFLKDVGRSAFPNPETSKMGEVDIEAQRVRAITGTMIFSAIAIAVAASLDDDDDKAKFLVTAQGPRDADEKRLWRQRGLNPFSVRVAGVDFNYKETPFFAIFAPLGALSDAKRYDGGKHWETVLDRIAATGVMTARALSEQAALDSLAKLTGTVAGRSSTSEEASMAQPFKGMATVALFPNFGREINDIIYGPPDTKTRSWAAAMLANVPFAPSLVKSNPAINVFGEPIQETRGGPLGGLGNLLAYRVATKPIDDPQMHFAAKMDISKLMTRRRKTDGTAVMEDYPLYYEWAKRSGVALRKELTPERVSEFEKAVKADKAKAFKEFDQMVSRLRKSELDDLLNETDNP